MDELLNFSSDIGEEDDEGERPRKALLPSSASLNINGVLGQDDPRRSFHVSFDFWCIYIYIFVLLFIYFLHGVDDEGLFQ